VYARAKTGLMTYRRRPCNHTQSSVCMCRDVVSSCRYAWMMHMSLHHPLVRQIMRLRKLCRPAYGSTEVATTGTSAYEVPRMSLPWLFEWSAIRCQVYRELNVMHNAHEVAVRYNHEGQIILTERIYNSQAIAGLI
jgi:hypothetical protein